MNKKPEEEYIEEDYQASGSRFPKWALIAGVVFVFLCLAVLLTLFLARTKILNFAVGMLATETPIPTETSMPTETSLPPPTEPPPPTEGPTQAPAPTAIPMPPSAITAIAQGGPILEEGFADNARNWIGINDKSEVTIQEQKLQLRSNDPGKAAAGICQGDACGPYKDYYYFQAEMVEDRPSTLALGMVFGMNDQKNNFYCFAIRPSSAEYALYKVINGEWTTLIDWVNSPAVKFFPFVNILGVSYSNGAIQLFANGEQLSAFTDSQQPYKSGRIGFSVETDGVRLIASNVKVFNLAQVAPQPPAGQGVTYQTPTPQIKITATPTKWGACPAGVPDGVFVFVVFKSTPKQATIDIDGVKKKIVQGANTFYLTLGDIHVITLGSKVLQLNYKTCAIRQVNYSR